MMLMTVELDGWVHAATSDVDGVEIWRQKKERLGRERQRATTVRQRRARRRAEAEENEREKEKVWADLSDKLFSPVSRYERTPYF